MCRKNITLYGVIHKDNPNAILTLAPTKTQALEYISNLLRLAFLNDYKSWAYFNKIEKLDDENNWYQYMRLRVPEEKFLAYSLVKCKFNADAIALALRTFNQCMPTGSSFENEVEFLKLGAACTLQGKMSEDLQFVKNQLIQSVGINPNMTQEKADALQAAEHLIDEVEEDA